MKRDWERVALGSVVEIASGQVDPRQDPYCNMTHVGGENIESHTGRLLNLKTAGEQGLISGKYLFGPSDVLYSKIRPALNKVVAPDFEGICSADIYPLRPINGKLCKEFLVHLLRSAEFLGYTATCSSRTNIPKINREALFAYQSLMPPLPEQRRIAAILDKADAIRRKWKESIRLTEELLRSTFLDMFGDPEPNPKGWDFLPVSEVIAEMEGGKSLLADADESRSTHYRVLKVSAVTWADYRPHESKPVPPEYVPPPSHIVRKGDLLFSRANTTELVGATVYVFETPPNHLLPDKLWRFVWRSDRPVDPHYIHALFMTAAIRRELGKRATGTSGSMKNISKAKLMTIRIPVPPIDLQRRFGEFVTEHQKAMNARREATGSTEALFDSLVQRAFRGEL
jgi:type I restriction enzyme, S subunit